MKLTHERGAYVSLSPEVLSRGLSRLFLVHLFPHVNELPLGRGGHLVTLEDHRRGIKGQLELETPSGAGHRDALRLLREVVDDVLATDLIVEDAEETSLTVLCGGQRIGRYQRIREEFPCGIFPDDVKVPVT